MALAIPIFADKTADWVETVQLEGSSYRLRLWWSDQVGAWFASLSTLDGVELAISEQVSLDWPLFRSLVHDDLYPGQLWAVDIGEAGEITRENLGVDIKLIYLTAAEVEEIEAQAAASEPVLTVVIT